MLKKTELMTRLDEVLVKQSNYYNSDRVTEKGKLVFSIVDKLQKDLDAAIAEATDKLASVDPSYSIEHVIMCDIRVEDNQEFAGVGSVYSIPFSMKENAKQLLGFATNYTDGEFFGDSGDDQEEYDDAAVLLGRYHSFNEMNEPGFEGDEIER